MRLLRLFIDFCIAGVTISSLSKEQALSLAQAYHIKLNPDQIFQTLTDLKPKLALWLGNFTRRRKETNLFVQL